MINFQQLETELEQGCAALTSDAEAKAADFVRQAAKLRGAAQAQIKALRAAFVAEIASRHDMLATELSELRRATLAYRADPSRENANGVAVAFLTLDARHQEALGAPICSTTLGHVFADDVVDNMPSAANVFSDDHVWAFDGPGLGSLCEQAVKFFRSNIGVYERALSELEHAIAVRAAASVGPAHEECVRRWRVRRACLTYGVRAERLAALEKTLQAEAIAKAPAHVGVLTRIRNSMSL